MILHRRGSDRQTLRKKWKVFRLQLRAAAVWLTACWKRGWRHGRDMWKTTQVVLTALTHTCTNTVGVLHSFLLGASQQDGRPPAFAWEEEGTSCSDVILTQTNWNNLPCVFFFSLTLSVVLKLQKKEKSRSVFEEGCWWLRVCLVSAVENLLYFYYYYDFF